MEPGRFIQELRIIAGSIVSIGLIVSHAHFVFGSDFPMSLPGLNLPFNERGFDFLISVWLIGLRWFFVYGNPPTTMNTDPSPASSAAKALH